MKPCLIFDYDGTLHNTMRIYEPAFRNAYRWLAEENYVKEEPVSSGRIASWLGKNSWEMWNDFQPELTDKIKEKASALVGAAMVQKTLAGEAAWYPGAQEMLEELKKQEYPMVILSNCRTSYAKAHWEQFQMERWFLEIFDCESYGFAPKTEIIKNIAEKYAGPYIGIGDRRGDMECIRTVGGKFIGCAYGFGNADELEGADALVKQVTEIPRVLSQSSRLRFT